MDRGLPGTYGNSERRMEGTRTPDLGPLRQTRPQIIWTESLFHLI